jgi:single-strand DNA-binding protein
MNNVNIIGRLVRDPETNKTDAGLSICNLRMAIDDTFSRDDRTDFISITVFGNQADVCKKYLRKGFMFGATGRIRSDAYTDSEGVKKYPVKIIADRIQLLQWPERTEQSKAEQEKAEPGNESAAQEPKPENGSKSPTYERVEKPEPEREIAGTH